MKFVDDVGRCWRWFSVQAMAAATAIQATWVLMPESMHESLPKNWVQAVTAALMVLGIWGRLVPQPPKDAP